MINITPTMRHLPRPPKPLAPFRWYGGKGMLVKWILPWVRWGKVYVEPFCGAASVFWHKQPHPVEVLNDLNGDVVNVFRCLQDPKTFRELAHRIAWTPHSRAEFGRALEILQCSHEPVERAWAFMVAYGQGFNGEATTIAYWGRVITKSVRNMAEPCSRLRSRIALLRWWHDRLTCVQLDCRDALEVIRYWDSSETLFYIDPPYPPSTRRDRKVYTYEMIDEQHQALLETILDLQGQVVLSSYPCDMYTRYLKPAGWLLLQRKMACYAACKWRNSGLQGKGAAKKKVPRTEVLWISPGLQNRSATQALLAIGEEA